MAGAALGVVAYNVTKETLEAREDAHLDKEKKSLESIKENKKEQLKSVLEARENIGKNTPDAPVLKFLDTKIPDIFKNPPESVPEKPFEGSFLKQCAKAVVGGVLETIPIINAAIESASSVIGLAAGAAALFNVKSGAEQELARMKEKNHTINQINELKLSATDYKNPKELQELERQEQINTKALEEFLTTTPKIGQLKEQELRDHFNVTRAKVAENPQFAPPPERTKVQRAVSAAKAGWRYFAKSQFEDLQKVYSKQEEQTQTQNPVTPNVDKKPQEPEKSKEHSKKHEKAEEQAKNAQNNLSKNQTEYNSSIQTPQTPSVKTHEPSHHGTHGSSR